MGVLQARPATAGGLGLNGSLAAVGLRGALAGLAGVALEAVLVAGVFEGSSGALTAFTSASAVNVAGNDPAAAGELEGLLEALGVPSFTPSASAGPRGYRALQEPVAPAQAAAPLPRWLQGAGSAGISSSISAGGRDAALALPADFASSPAARAAGGTRTLLIAFNILGRVLGTVEAAPVVAIKARMAEAYASSPGALQGAAASALAALAPNSSSASSLTMDAPGLFIVLLPRVHIYSLAGGSAQGAALSAAAPQASAAVLGGAAAGAAALCLCLAAAALLLRRRKKQTAKVAPAEEQLAKAVASEEQEQEEEEQEEDEEEEVLPPHAEASEGTNAAAGGATEAADSSAGPSGSLSEALEGLLSRARGIQRVKRKLGRGGGEESPAGGQGVSSAVEFLAHAAATAKLAGEAVEASAAQRRERLREAQEAVEAHRRSEKMAALLALPKHARGMLLETKGDTRKWWSAPRVPPKQSKVDKRQWAPLAKEKAAVLAAGGVWPPPDPLLALMDSGEGKLVGGQVVRVSMLEGDTEEQVEEAVAAAEGTRKAAALQARVSAQRVQERVGMRGRLLALSAARVLGGAPGGARAAREAVAAPLAALDAAAEAAAGEGGGGEPGRLEATTLSVLTEEEEEA